MTPEQKALARHALGLPHRTGQSYRNHFVAGEGSDDFELWRDLAHRGFAKRRAGSPLSGGDEIFWLTRAGAEHALEPGETLNPTDFPPIGAH